MGLQVPVCDQKMLLFKFLKKIVLFYFYSSIDGQMGIKKNGNHDQKA